jgi:hypothetical protein
LEPGRDRQEAPTELRREEMAWLVLLEPRQPSAGILLALDDDRRLLHLSSKDPDDLFTIYVGNEQSREKKTNGLVSAF